MRAPRPGRLCIRCVFRQMVGSVGLEQDKAEEFPRAFGDYELRAEIARGGMGVVYRAWHRPLNRTVAVKVLLAGAFASRHFLRRFQREAEAAASLDHPNIVPIYEIGEYDGQSFFSMKLIEGGTLGGTVPLGGRKRNTTERDDRTSLEPISEAGIARVIAKLARAVQYAHERGILHRDLKPNNVLVDTQGEPYLTDFGLARSLENDSTLTQSMSVLGTPSYLSPEQARGSQQLTTAADVYGLGAILYELLAGRPPFVGASILATVQQVLACEPVPPSATRGVSVSRVKNRDLEIICLKCLEKEPSRRYPSAEALAADLERWLRQEPIEARPASKRERLSKWTRRNPASAALAVTTVGAVFTILLGALLFASLLSRARRETEKVNQVLAYYLSVRERNDAEKAARMGELTAGLRSEGLRRHPLSIWYADFRPDVGFTLTGDRTDNDRSWDSTTPAGSGFDSHWTRELLVERTRVQE
ncbi:MAG TPA: serine/threonine-protein kinase [Verrucomicrobiota bacterium]|nr:serine/threonine-protein kinase [Verrucomicrobiota bacterium]